MQDFAEQTGNLVRRLAGLKSAPYALILALTATGCASSEYAISSQGHLPATGASYRLVQLEDEPMPLPADIHASLTARLTNEGLVEAKEKTDPQLLLFAAFASKPGRISASTIDAENTPLPLDTLTEIDEFRPLSTSLSLRLVEAETGNELWAVRAEARHRKHAEDRVRTALVERAFATVYSQAEQP